MNKYICIKYVLVWLILYYIGVEYIEVFLVGVIGGFYFVEEKVMFLNILCVVGGGYDGRIGVFIVFKNGFYIIFCNVVGNFTVKIMINGLVKVGVMVYYGFLYNYGYDYIGFNFIV